MIDVISVYEDVRESASEQENGRLSYDRFNRLSKRAELRLLDYLSGDVENLKPPIPNLSQKNSDWLSHLKEPFKTSAVGGFIIRPENFYSYDNMYLIGTVTSKSDCEIAEEENEEAVEEPCNVPVEILSTDEFYERCRTYIKGLKPSMKKPIAKQIGNKFEFRPSDVGSLTLEYTRYPVYAEIKTKHDEIHNDEIADPDTSIKYDWPEAVREMLTWFIIDTFALDIRDGNLKGLNASVGKLVRDTKQ